MCELILSASELEFLSEAIEENYYFEFIIDDIPVRDFVGHLEESGFLPHSHKIYLWTHNHFAFYYNQDKVSYECFERIFIVFSMIAAFNCL